MSGPEFARFHGLWGRICGCFAQFQVVRGIAGRVRQSMDGRSLQVCAAIKILPRKILSWLCFVTDADKNEAIQRNLVLF